MGYPSYPWISEQHIPGKRYLSMGVRDLLEIPLTWQEPFIYQCDFANQTCDNLITSELQIPKDPAITAQGGQ